ncbi:hypothetical protein SETIT_4G143000v2 [Setaria italica]|uniref:Uncharacterized protein n=1 Tax=Setaria italica TaxID=4555 RepID=A0A368QW16_SETIT|nr:hypothetical protein SETIT_4G143000v2 [Setaria italica]
MLACVIDFDINLSERQALYHGNSAIQCQPQEVGGSSGCSPSISSP